MALTQDMGQVIQIPENPSRKMLSMSSLRQKFLDMEATQSKKNTPSRIRTRCLKIGLKREIFRTSPSLINAIEYANKERKWSAGIHSFWSFIHQWERYLQPKVHLNFVIKNILLIQTDLFLNIYAKFIAIAVLRLSNGRCRLFQAALRNC